MDFTTLKLNVQSHPFFKRFKPEFLSILEGGASLAEFEPDSLLFRENERATYQFLLIEGLVALDFEIPGKEVWTLMTACKGGIVGYAWAYPPNRYYYNCRALKKTKAIVLDAEYLLGKCQENYEFGYTVMVGCVDIVAQRFQAARFQLLNLVLQCY
jgi:CRP/FNR family transcriptional regulator, cyclic AMP receptor protein